MDDLTSLDIPLHTLYSCCLDTLKSISALALPSESLKTYHARLKIWGAGLFTEGPSLDKILEEEPKRYGPLISGLQKTLFSIAVEEVVFLKSRRALNDNYDIDLQLEPQTKALLILVSQNDTAVLTCERRLPHLVNTSKIGTVEPLTLHSSPSQDIRPSSSNRGMAQEDQSLRSQGARRGLINRISKKFPTGNEVISLFTKKEDTVGRVRATSPLLGEHGLKEDGNASLSQPSEACHEDYDMYLGAFVESLFDLLPSIRGIRRTRLLETEFHQSNEIPSSSDLVNQVTSHEESLPQPAVSAEQGPLGDKILELALPSVDDNQRSTLTVFRKSDIAFRLVSTTKDEQKPGFSVEKSVNVDMNSARFIPAFATPDPGGPINNKVLLCNSQGKDRICHTFQDSSAIAEFQRALLGYRVLNYMSNISWNIGFSKSGRKAISGKARLQLWQLKPFPDLLPSLAGQRPPLRQRPPPRREMYREPRRRRRQSPVVYPSSSEEDASSLPIATRRHQQRTRSLSPRSRYEEEKRAISGRERRQHGDRFARAARLEQQVHDRARSLSPGSRYKEEKKAIEERERQQHADKLARAARLEQEAHDRVVRLTEDERRNRQREQRQRRLEESEERRRIERARRRQQREEEERNQSRRDEAREHQKEVDKERLRQQQGWMAEQEHLKQLRRANIPRQPHYQPIVHRESLDNRGDYFMRKAIEEENARQWVRERQIPSAAYGRYDGGFLGRRNTIDGRLSLSDSTTTTSMTGSRGDGIALARPEPPVLVIFTMCENKYTFFHIKIERGLSAMPQTCSECQDQNKTCSGVLIQSSSKEWNFRKLSAQLDKEQGLDSWDLACFRYPEHPAFQDLEQVTGVKYMSLHFETTDESEVVLALFESPKVLRDTEILNYDRMQPKARREISNYDRMNPLARREIFNYDRMKLQGRRDTLTGRIKHEDEVLRV